MDKDCIWPQRLLTRNRKKKKKSVALRYRPVCPQPLPPRPPSSAEELDQTERRQHHHHRVDMTPFVEQQREDCLNLNVYIPATGIRCTVIACSAPMVSRSSRSVQFSTFNRTQLALVMFSRYSAAVVRHKAKDSLCDPSVV